MGGRALGRDDIFQFGLDVLEACWHAYNATPTGIAPESISSFYTSDLDWGWESNDTAQEPGVSKHSNGRISRFWPSMVAIFFVQVI